jgi:hypothetical protein
MFSVQKAALVETHLLAAAAANQNPPSKNLHQKIPMSSFSKSFIYSGKQGGGATVLREGRDIVTKGTCVPSSLNLNNLGKAAMLYSASHSLLRLGLCQTQPVDKWAQLCLCQVLRGFS